VSGPKFCEFSEKREPSTIEGTLNFDKMENCVVCEERFVAFIARDLILMVENPGGGEKAAFLIWNFKKNLSISLKAHENQ